MPAQPFHHIDARRLAIRPGERPRGGCHHPPLVDHGQDRQAVPLADLEVGGVVAWRDLHRAGPERGIDGLVRDDLHATLDLGYEHLAAHEGPPALDARMHRDRDVGHDRLGARRGHDDVGRSRGHLLGPGVADVVERIRALHVERLEIGVGRLVLEAPVHDPVGAIEVSAPVEPDEVRPHRALLRRLHREVRPRPVERAPEHPQLSLDPRPVVVHPPPHLGDELLASEGLARDPLFRELVLDHHLGDDPGVIGAGHVERGLALHAVVARHEVLVAAEAEGVTEVEIPRDVGQRQHHHERRFPTALVGREEAASLPPVVEVGLDGGRTEVLLSERERGCGRGRHRGGHLFCLLSRQTKSRLAWGESGPAVPPRFTRRCAAPLLPR